MVLFSYLFTPLFKKVFMTMADYSDTVRRLLNQGPMSSRQLYERIGVSQPTISRILKGLAGEIVRFGSGSSIQYALRDHSRGVSFVPIYRVSEDGQIKALGELIPVRPDGFVMVQANGVSLHSDGLPWWMYDMRPQGYLGRAYALKYAGELGLPTNPERWTDLDIIRALLAHGHDAVGNLLIGELAREHFLTMQEPTPVKRSIEYPRLAANAGEAPGSSAGGEQPKFCSYTDCGHVLVKFSAADNNPVSERWRDLLLAEHLALGVLGIETKLFDFCGQRFLEVPRFDRIGKLGRIGVFSLRALDAEFVGKGSASWPVIVNRLVEDGHVHDSAIIETAKLWAFGALIGNTDMHTGNLSFVSSHGRPYRLAPPYDVLPMGFAPKSSGELVNELPLLSMPNIISGDCWREALARAEQFLTEAERCDRFSVSFTPCLHALRSHLDEAKERIARLA